MDIKTVGIVGCGLMGSGIVEVVARKGYKVIVREINDEFLNKGLDKIKTSMSRAVERNKMTAEERDTAWARIQPTIHLADFAPCDFVVEAVIENLDLKKHVFSELDRVTRPEVILSSNTSSLAVTQMGAVTQRQDRVLGMHFFNPVPVLPLLEMVRTFVTSDETYRTARAFGESLGKTVIVSQDRPGFIVNALLVPYQLDSIRMLENGIASAEDIDTGVRLGLNHPMGPLTLADFVGLDTILFIADAMFEETKDAKFAAPTLLRRMVTAGYHGRKTGKGFYEYGK